MKLNRNRAQFAIAITRKEIATVMMARKLKASAEEEKKYEIIKTPLKKYVWRGRCR